ncbi:hypothetical protein [Microtetraspora niveoalba]|uniref:hypothetical protein n=1 Tax=Microtetraspora niveoalba TaxID=46175 RepID=UPI00082DD9D5|nr:hypothetical protein [Microtetraspora niveoalba]
MRKRSAVLAVLTTAVTLAVPAAASAAVGAPPAGIPSGASALPARGTTTFSFRGMNLRMPSAWKVRRYGDTARVITGPCTDPEYFYADCKSFWLVGPKTLAYWGYTGKDRYVPTLTQPSCPFGGMSLTVLGDKATSRGLRQVGRGHAAAYTAWPGYCEAQGSSGRKVHFTQREWFLPTSKILVVDLWDHKGLSGVLKNATWS